MWASKKAVAPVADTPREIPYDIDIEQALLGSLLVDNTWFERATLDLKPFDFYDPMHQRMFECMRQMWSDGMVVTPLTIKTAMGEDEGFAEVGGLAYVISLARSAPGLPNVKDYVRILKEFELRRHLIRIGEDISNQAYIAPLGEVSGIASRAADALFDAATHGVVKRPVKLYDAAGEMLKTHEDRLAGKRHPVIKTGFYKLDAELGGWRGKLLTTIAGRSGMGKSALMAAIALNTALAGYPVLIFSLEMSREQWVERTLCDIDFWATGGSQSALHYRRFNNGTATGDEFDRAAVAQGRLHNLPIEIVDDDQLTIEDITARARAYALDKGPLGLFAMDYMQIVVPSAGDSREQQVNHIARGTKSIAKQTGWHMIAGAQLLNKGKNAEDEERRPTAGDIRETGGIEAESDLILCPWRKAFFLEQTRQQAKQSESRKEVWLNEYRQTKNKFELLALKNRHGRRFDLELWCDMGAAAIRDDAPSTFNQAAQELLI